MLLALFYCSVAVLVPARQPSPPRPRHPVLQHRPRAALALAAVPVPAVAPVQVAVPVQVAAPVRVPAAVLALAPVLVAVLALAPVQVRVHQVPLRAARPAARALPAHNLRATPSPNLLETRLHRVIALPEMLPRALPLNRVLATLRDRKPCQTCATYYQPSMKVMAMLRGL